MQVFICTKPLQVMIAMILSRDKGSGFLYVVDSFSGARSLLESSELKNWFSKVEIFKSRNSALLSARKLKPSAIFLDSDVGLKPFFFTLIVKCFLKNCYFNVYEEGVGTYRRDIIGSHLKRRIYELVGAGTFLGGSKLTDKRFVFNKERYMSVFSVSESSVVSIPVSIDCFVEEFFEKILLVFEEEFRLPEIRKEKAVIFLTNWELNVDAVNSASVVSGDFFLKLHPHVKSFDCRKLNSSITVLPSSVPSELFLLLLAKLYRDVDVLHFGTSSETYMSKLGNLNWRKMS